MDAKHVLLGKWKALEVIGSPKILVIQIVRSDTIALQVQKLQQVSARKDIIVQLVVKRAPVASVTRDITAQKNLQKAMMNQNSVKLGITAQKARGELTAKVLEMMQKNHALVDTFVQPGHPLGHSNSVKIVILNRHELYIAQVVHQNQ
jgi:hypothetical protein